MLYLCLYDADVILYTGINVYVQNNINKNNHIIRQYDGAGCYCFPLFLLIV